VSDLDERWIALMGTSIVIVFIIAIAAIAIVSQIKAPAQTAQSILYLIRAGSIIRLVTIMAIVAAVSILCALGKIQGEAAIAILSSIAGYVLGNEKAARAERREENSN
jgi:hypothetical protein